MKFFKKKAAAISSPSSQTGFVSRTTSSLKGGTPRRPSPLLTIHDPSAAPEPSAKKSPLKSLGVSFHALLKGQHKVRNWVILGMIVLLGAGGTYYGIDSGWLQGDFQSQRNFPQRSILKLKPDITSVKVGEEFNVDIVLNTNSQETTGTDAYLTYDSQVLEVIDADPAKLGIQITPGTLYSFYGTNEVDPAMNKITLFGTSFTTATFSSTEDKVFGTIKFKAIKAANSTEVKFKFVPPPASIASDDSNVMMKLDDQFNGDVLGSVTNAVYTVTGSTEEVAVEITTNDGADFETDLSSKTLKGTTSTTTARISVNGTRSNDYTAGEDRWTTRVDLTPGRNRVTVEAQNADGSKKAQDSITITYTPTDGTTPPEDTNRPYTPPVSNGPDSDADGIPDDIETTFRLDENDPLDGATDTDGDGCTNVQEYLNGTDPRNVDTDGDGLPDCWEIEHGLNPLDPSDGAGDSDGDGCSVFDEYLRSTDVTKADTDGDGSLDCDDANPLVADVFSSPTTPTTPTTPATNSPPTTSGTGPGTVMAVIALFASFGIAGSLRKRNR